MNLVYISLIFGFLSSIFVVVAFSYETISMFKKKTSKTLTMGSLALQMLINHHVLVGWLALWLHPYLHLLTTYALPPHNANCSYRLAGGLLASYSSSVGVNTRVLILSPVLVELFSYFSYFTHWRFCTIRHVV